MEEDSENGDEAHRNDADDGEWTLDRVVVCGEVATNRPAIDYYAFPFHHSI